MLRSHDGSEIFCVANDSLACNLHAGEMRRDKMRIAPGIYNITNLLRYYQLIRPLHLKDE